MVNYLCPLGQRPSQQEHSHPPLIGGHFLIVFLRYLIKDLAFIFLLLNRLRLNWISLVYGINIDSIDGDTVEPNSANPERKLAAAFYRRRRSNWLVF